MKSKKYKISDLDKYGINNYKIYGYIAIFFLILDVAMGLAIPFISQYIIDTVVPTKDWNMVWVMSGVMIGCTLVGLISLVMNSIYSQKAAAYAATDLRREVYTKIQGLSFKNVDHFKHGRLVTTVTNDVTQLKNYYGMKYTMMTRAPLMLIIGVMYALLTSIKLSIIFAFIIPSLVVSIIAIMFTVRPFFKIQQESIDEINTVAIDNVNAPRVFKTFVTEENEAKRFDIANEKLRKNATKATVLIGLFFPIAMTILNVGIAFIFIIGARFIDTGIIPANAGVFNSFIMYTGRINIAVMMFAMMFMFVSRASISAKRIGELMDVEIDVKNMDNARVHFELKGEIEFRDVSFSYTDGSNNVFNKLNLTINAGERVGIIGSTGSGKSSFIKLIPRLYDVTDGELLIDGIDIREYNMQALRSQISMATQEPVVFGGTIKSNIIQGKKDATEEEIRYAAEMACALEFVESKENGFDSEVQSRGRNLSGGQKQRLSLARALIRKPSILILDDVTSALDAKSEEKVRNNLKSFENMTTIIVSQKISSIIEMDRIIVLDNYGNVDGFDNHYKLLEKSKVYKELYESQFGDAL